MAKLIYLIALTCGISALCFSQSGQTTKKAPNKLALLIGIDKYKYPNVVPSLAGCVNDVEDMKTVLVGKFEFLPENILVLENEQATHQAIVAAIKTHLIAKAQPGDIVVVHYSGHGSQMRDISGRKISGVDETIVPYDSRDPEGKVFDIPGFELHALLQQLSEKTGNITLIMDSCHSGTLARGARVRAIDPDRRKPPPMTAFAGSLRGMQLGDTDALPRFALIAAATSKESAFEYGGGDRPHGALSWFLNQQLRNAKPQETWRDVMDAVTANVTQNYPSQHPQLEGAQGDQQIFGGAIMLARGYVAVAPLDGSRVELKQGEVSGMTAGSTFDIYEPGTKFFETANGRLATAQVTSVSEFAAEARLISGGPVPAGARAIERIHRYEKPRLRVYLAEKEKSKTLQALSEALAARPEIEIASDATRCNLVLDEKQGRVLLLTADRASVGNPVPASSDDALTHLQAELALWAKWFNVLAIAPAFAGPDIDVAVGASKVSEGDRVSVTVRNRSAIDLYITILDLSSDGSIGQLYPTTAGASEVLKPGLSITKNFVAFVPPGKTTANDTLKVFASTKPIDLTRLTQTEIRDAAAGETDGSDPLNDLLAGAAGVSRGLKPEGPADARVGSEKVAEWNVAQTMLSIRRK